MPSSAKFTPGDSQTTLPVNSENSLYESEDKVQVNVIKISDDSGDSGDSDNGTSTTEFPEPFAGMGKEMVLHYSNTPAWNRTRKILLIIFWGSWLILLGSVIYLTWTHERCKLPPVQKWWQKTSFYQISPGSFLDSDGDGIGDLNGIKSKLDYLKDINVESIWLGAFYKSPMLDSGYGVSDYRDVHHKYGTLAEFDELLADVHNKGLKLIIDFIPNHTSDEHSWFEGSANRDPLFDDYYIWSDCGTETNVVAPNNWLSINGSSAWTYHPIRKQCYYHQYQKNMPDLNIRNNKVKVALDEMLRYWLNKGVDGISVDSVDRLFEDYNLADEAVIDPSKPADYDSLNHTNTRNLPEVVDMLNRWRGILDSYTDSDRLMITDAEGTPSDLRRYYGRTQNGGAHLPLNYQLLKIQGVSGGSSISRLVGESLSDLPENCTTNWVLEGLEESRVASRVGLVKLDVLHMLLLLLPGVSTSYYGDEIGIVDSAPTSYLNKERSGPIMRWTPDVTDCYGFTSNCTFPVGSDATNVEMQNLALTSHLNVYKNLTKLRVEGSFAFGDWKEHVVTENIYSFFRYYDGFNTYLVAMNVGDEEEKVDMSEQVQGSATSGTVVLAAGGLQLVVGEETLDLDSISLKPGEGVVLTWPYTIKQLI